MFTVEKNVTDSDIRATNRPHIARLMATVTPPSEAFRTAMKREKTVIEKISDLEQFLKFMGKHQGLPVRELIKRSDFAGEKFDKLKDSSIDKGYLREIKIQTGKRGGQPLVYELTQKAKDLVKVKHKIRGGAEHDFWVRRILENYKNKGFNGRSEEDNCDLIIRRNGFLFGVEVVMSKDNHQSVSVYKSLETKCERIIVACRNADIKEYMERKFKSYKYIDLKKMVFCEVRDFLNQQFSFDFE